MRKKWVMGNWKMNGSTKMVSELVKALKTRLTSENVECALCPPFVYLQAVETLLNGSPIALGAQDVSRHAPGAYTGEVAAEMLADMGCTYVLLGHSERRQYHQESNALVAEKFVRARQVGLRPVVCIGETLVEREAGKTEAVVAEQLQAVLAVVKESDFAEMILAYEPVWAIGTGKTATPEQVEAVHAFLRDCCAKRSEKLAKGLRIVYGGSVKSANAKALFALPNVDGGLIGGASLIADEFVAICQAAQ